jgi:hypothetical protein
MATDEQTPQKKSMNRNVLMGVAVLVILLLVGGGAYFLANRNAEPEDDAGFVEEQLPKMDPKELGLAIIPSSDKRYIQFKVTKSQGIKHLEWEFTYDADATETGDGEGGGGRVTQGFGGEADITSENKEFVSEKRELGTCSTGGKCRFDTGIETIKLILKVTKADGKVYQAEDSISL